MKCPQCGKALRTKQNVYERRINPATGLEIAHTKKVKIGERPAVNRYAPFCTLRCGWKWATDHIAKAKRRRYDGTEKR